MRVIVVNSGSSSIKYEVFTLDDCASVVQGLLERIGTRDARFRRRWLTDSGDWEEIIESQPIADHREGFQFLLDAAVRYPTTRVAPGAFFGFGHRVVHGGEVFHEPVIIDDDVIRRIKELIPLAPPSQPAQCCRHRGTPRAPPGCPQRGGLRHGLSPEHAAQSVSLRTAQRIVPLASCASLWIPWNIASVCGARGRKLSGDSGGPTQPDHHPSRQRRERRRRAGRQERRHFHGVDAFGRPDHGHALRRPRSGGSFLSLQENRQTL